MTSNYLQKLFILKRQVFTYWCYKKTEFPYLITPRSTVLLDKLTGFQLVKEFPTLYVT